MADNLGSDLKGDVISDERSKGDVIARTPYPHTDIKQSDLEMSNINCSQNVLTTDVGHGQGVGVMHPTSYIDTIMHLFRGNVGSGLYAMGYAFKNGGIFFGTGCTLLLAVISVHCQHILITISDEMAQRVNLNISPDYAETVYHCFATGPAMLRPMAKSMRTVANTFLVTTQLGFCCVYFVFISTSINKILDHFEVTCDIHIIMLIVLVPILGVSLIRNLKNLAPVSSLANLLMIIGVAITLYFASQNLPSVTTRRYVADWNTIPLYFGTTIYAFEGIGLVLPLKNEMKNPRLFQGLFGVLNVGMTVVTILIITVGFLGYLQWGDGVQGSLTLNLPQDDILCLIVQGILAVSLTLTFPIQFYVPVEIIFHNIERRFKSKVTTEIVLRVLLVLVTFTLAEIIPKLGLFIALVGSISSTALALIIPPVLEHVLLAQSPRKTPLWIIIKNVFIIVIGIVGFATGTYESIREIIVAFIE